MSDNIVQLTDAGFEADVIKAAGPVLVDFWAEWCGPCKMIAPILEEVATEYAGRVTIGKLNIDQNSETPPKYGIRGIPPCCCSKTAQWRRPRLAPSPSPSSKTSSTPISNPVSCKKQGAFRPPVFFNVPWTPRIIGANLYNDQRNSTVALICALSYRKQPQPSDRLTATFPLIPIPNHESDRT